MRDRTKSPRGIAALGALLLTGCLTARYTEGSAIPWEAVARIEPGRTTRSEILERFGAPTNFARPTALVEFLEANGLESASYLQYPQEDVFVYQLGHGRLRAWTLLVYTRVTLHIDEDLVVVTFDDEDRVRLLGVRRAGPLED